MPNDQTMKRHCFHTVLRRISELLHSEKWVCSAHLLIFLVHGRELPTFPIRYRRGQYADIRLAKVHMAQIAKAPARTHLLLDLRFNLESVEAGVPVDTMTSFVSASGMELKDIYDIVIPARTLKHRRSRKESLSRDESDKLARLVRVFDQSVTVFGDVEQARQWLNKSKKRFDDRTPLQMLRTDLGGRMVEEMLGQIDEGMFA